MLNLYRCPESCAELKLEDVSYRDKQIDSGRLVAPTGRTYEICNGVPDFTWPLQLTGGDAEARETYDQAAALYDINVSRIFEMFGEDETASRNEVIDLLELGPNAKVLETGAGTGRDSTLICERLAPGGLLCIQDISRNLFEKAIARLGDAQVPVSPHIGNAGYLPFPDNSFDAYFHVGGINGFSEIGRALSEAVRVTQPGGRVVVADENMPVWLRDTEFAKILINSNPLFASSVPFEHLPVEARDVSVRWKLGGVFFVIAFTVGDGAPKADFDIPIYGARGGTHRTRYFGRLEGVGPEVKALAQAAQAKSGKSMHEWLNEVLHAAATQELDDPKK